VEVESQGLQHYTIDQWRQDLSHVTAGRKSGFSNLDKLAMIPEGAITIVAGRPNMGKTTMLLNLLYGMESQDKEPGAYLFFSYEEAKKILLAKLLMLRTERIFNASKNLGQYLGKVRDGWQPGQHTDLDEAYKKLQQLTDSGRIILVDHPYRVEDLVQVIEKTASVQPIRAVFLDYIQKIRPSRSGQARYLDVAETSEAIRVLAVTLNVPIIVGAQLGRPDKQTKDKGLRLDNLRESGDLEQDANLVLAIHRDSVHKAEGSEEAMISEHSTDAGDHEETMEVYVLKNRNGPTGKLAMSFIGPIYKIKEKIRSL
jgi:replicative DNA helicase